MSVEEVRKQIWVSPCIDCGCDCEGEGQDHYRLVYEIPGVKKENIHLHIIKEGLRLRAKLNDKTEYVNEYVFSCDADPEKAKAKYENGVLEVEVPYVCPDPFSGAKLVTIE